jgi:ribulose kinase
MWLAEGGQSATGALVDHVIFSHARGAELHSEAASRGTSVYSMLNERLEVLAQGAPFPAAIARDLHVLPDHHGNRSPRADPTLRGMISGIKLTDSLDSLALLYLATVQAVAHGTRHIVDVMRSHAYPLDTILACGGGTKNEVFLREHADATGCRVVLPAEPEAVLLGAAILGAVASGDRGSIIEAMSSMTRVGRTIEPAHGHVARFHDAKHKVFLRMHEDQLAYREVMHG